MRIAIVGCGDVGATLAHVILQKGFQGEVLLINRTYDRALGCYLDLTHASAFHTGVSFVPMSFAGLAQCQHSDVIVLTAGSGLGPYTHDRNQLAVDNAKLLLPILRQLGECRDSVFLVVTNPVDNLTYLTARHFSRLGQASRRVVGLGTTVESARFRAYLAHDLDRDPRSLQSKADVLGEHGSGMVAITSQLGELESAYDKQDVENFSYLIRNAALFIRATLGSGPKYSIALCAWEVIARVLGGGDTNGAEYLTTCSFVEQSPHYGLEDVCLSLPTVIGRSGVDKIKDIEISKGEREALQKSAAGLKEELQRLKEALRTEAGMDETIASLCP